VKVNPVQAGVGATKWVAHLVQDSADSLALMLNILGNEVRTTRDGLEAVDLAVTFNPEIVLMGIGLPILNGYFAARRSDQPLSPSLPFNGAAADARPTQRRVSGPKVSP